MNVKNLLLGVPLLSIAACASFKPVEYTKTSEENILPRASFEMSCPKEDIEFIVISSNVHGYPEEIGVKGCGKKIVYVRLDGQTRWFIDSRIAQKEKTNRAGNSASNSAGNQAAIHIMHHTP